MQYDQRFHCGWKLKSLEDPVARPQGNIVWYLKWSRHVAVQPEYEHPFREEPLGPGVPLSLNSFSNLTRDCTLSTSDAEV